MVAVVVVVGSIPAVGFVAVGIAVAPAKIVGTLGSIGRPRSAASRTCAAAYRGSYASTCAVSCCPRMGQREKRVSAISI